MPRTMQTVVPADRTDALMAALRQAPGLIGMQVQRGVSIMPPGDVVTIHVINRYSGRFLQLLDEQGLGRSPSSSLHIAIPDGLVSAPANREIVTDASESSWEEMEMLVAKESNMTLNLMGVMFAAGLLMVAGILGGVLHLAIAAMVIAPGFEPILRIPLGFASSSRTWRRGVIDTLKAYASLLVGAFFGVVMMRLLSPEGESGYVAPGALFSFWSTISAEAVAVSIIAGFAGAILVATHRSVLTAGVMIALALIPAPSVAVIALMSGDFESAGQAALRWFLEVGIVLATAMIVYTWKRQRIHRRASFW